MKYKSESAKRRLNWLRMFFYCVSGEGLAGSEVGTLVEKTQQSSCGYGRTDDTRHVRSHGMHEQEVVSVVFQTQVVGDTGAHRYGAHSSISYQWVDLLALWQEHIHQFDKQYSAG